MTAASDFIGGLASVAVGVVRGQIDAAMRDARDPVGAHRRRVAAIAEERRCQLAQVGRQLQSHAGELLFDHVAPLMIDLLASERIEILMLVIDSAREERVRVVDLARGTADAVDVPTKEIIKLARRHGHGSGFFMFHNHPYEIVAGEIVGESPLPSANDLRSATELRRELRALGVDIVEGVVCGDVCRLVECSRLNAQFQRRCRR